jgi:replicative DNA helicase
MRYLYDYGLPYSEKLDSCIASLVNRVEKNKASLLIIDGGIGEGKSFGKETPVLMYDGTIKKVEEVVVGDLVMGDNSTPRTVLKLGHGFEEMYKIIQTKGDSYTVNKSHILSLKRTRSDKFRYDNPNKEKHLRKDRKGEALNISVEDYLKLSKKQKGLWKGYKVGVEFNNKYLPLKINPYFLGIWLGDGTRVNTSITTMDNEVIDFCYKYAELLKLNIRVQLQKNNNSVIINIVNKKRTGNILRDYLKKYNVWNNKHIPNDYKLNNKEIKLSHTCKSYQKDLQNSKI